MGSNAIEDFICLLDLLLKLEEVIQIALDLIMRQINEHTSDLRGFLLTDHLLNVLVDELSYELLEVRVLWDHTRDALDSLQVVVLDYWVRMVEWLKSLDHDSSLLRLLLDWLLLQVLLMSVEGCTNLVGSLRGHATLVLSGTALAVVLLLVVWEDTTSLLLLLLAKWCSSVSTLVELTIGVVVDLLALDNGEDLLDELDDVWAGKDRLVERC